MMTETEWRNLGKLLLLASHVHFLTVAPFLGIQQSPGWVHYLLNNSEPNVVCFRKLKD
jgi:hypothetical protein